MHINQLHNWDITPSEAFKLQKKLTRRIITKNTNKINPNNRLTVAAVDVSYSRIEKVGFADIIVWDTETKEIIEEQTAIGEATFPYIPGLLTFREAPLVLSAISKLKSNIGVFIFDGQGVAHPRSCGLASHLGLFINTPSIGCAKKRLFGSYSEPGAQKGSRSFLYDDQHIIGTVLRTKRRCNPLFISVGHMIELETSVEIILKLTDKYRIPEPLRIADINTKKLRKKHNL
ncbi:MAG: endonuclease V [Planctomycetes bacterium]|nr:endonuclease V [Planctomycetota bacterium]